MKNIYALILVFILSSFGIVYSQTGPGGIGNADGSNGQPRNILWLRADDLSLSNGATVSAWPDSSGNGNDLSSSVNDPNDPTYVLNQINGLPVVRFSFTTGTGTKLIRNPFNGFASSEITTIVVYQTNDVNDGLISYAISSNSNNYLLYNSGNLTTYLAGGNQSSAQNLRSASFQIMVHKWRNSNGELHLIKNSTDIYNTLGFRQGYTITNGGCLAIGGEQDAVDGGYAANQAFDGDIAEIIMFSSYLNDAQRIIIENYLQIKYGISITPNDHFSSGDISYINNFTGIGQEADGNQMESSSAGFYVQADAGTLDNGEYIMFAHNNTANSVVDTDLPSGVEKRWARDWYAEKTGSLDATLKFDFPEGIDGQYPKNISNYVLLYRSGTTGNYSQVTATVNFGDADQVAFTVTDANLLSGYYTLGTKDETNSPLEGVAGRTWYTLASGDWDDWNTWTLDPSGALPNNAGHEYPQLASETVVIKSGKTVTMNVSNLHCNSLKVDGRLDLGTTTGHTFDVISGGGRILMAADNFPSYTDCSDFVDDGQDEGTVVYYGSSDYSLSNAYTFYNVEIDADAGVSVTLLNDYNINGSLSVIKGTLRINDNSATKNLNLTVKGDVTVLADGNITTGTANARHQFNMYGNFTNKGEVKFTNRTSAGYTSEATDGIIDANFLNDSKDQSISCEGITNFYRIEIDKGTDATYVLNIDATDAAYFNLFGYAAQGHGSVAQLTDNANALGLIMGTVRLGSNINIPVVSTASNYNISSGARLWVDGGTVLKNAGNAFVPYGTIEVSDGLLEAKVSSGITTRDNGMIKISGGTINTNVIRTSVLGSGNVGGYIQSGGTVNIVNNSTSDYYHFCLTYPGNTFSMTGGTLHVYGARAGSNQGGIFIASDPENINVTGGTVIAEVTNANPFSIVSKAPFYNLILRNTNDNTTDHILADAANVGSTNENLAAQPLVVLNDLTIEQNVMLKHNGQDITVGGNLYIDRNAQAEGVASDFIESNAHNRGIYYSASQVNTLRFNGSGNASFYIGYNTSDVIQWEFYCHNLEIIKDNISDTVTISTNSEKDPDNVSQEWHNRILHVIDTIWVRRGVINQGRQSVRLFGEVFAYKNGQMGVYDVNVPTPNTAYFMFRDGDVIVNTEKGAVFGNIKFNSTGTVTFTSDLYIKRIGYYSGLYNIGTHKLRVDYLHSNATSNNYSFGVNASKMIYSDANASDGGIELYIPANSSGYTIGLPLGTTANGTTRSTPAEIRIDTNTDDGYIQIRPVDGELKTTNLSGGNILSYYWRVGHSGFTTLPDVRLRFRYNAVDDDNNDEGNFVQGKVLDEDPYTRSSPSGWVNTSNNTIGFNTATLENANYTAGLANRFTGTVPTFTSYPGVRRRWNNTNCWQEGVVPTEGSIVTISNNSIVDVYGAQPSTAAPAETKLLNSGSRVQFYRNTSTYNLGIIKGAGIISFNMAYNPTVNGDFGDFASHSSSLYLFFTTSDGASYTMSNIPQPAPTINFESGRYTLNQPGLIINYDLVSGWNNYDIIIANDVLVKRDLRLSNYNRGGLHFPATGSAVTLTVERNVIVGDPILVDDPGVASTLEHKFVVGGDITVTDDNIDLFNASNRPSVILELTGGSDNTYTNSAGTIADLYRIILNKGTSQINTFTFNNSFTLNGLTSGISVSKALELQNGTLVLNNPAININLTTGDDNFVIPSTAALEVKQGTVKASGNSGILLDGKLKVSGGTVDMSGGDNYIQYSASGNATIEVTDGNLIVGSQIRRVTTSTEGVLTYKQSGGEVTIGADAAGAASRGVFEILNAGSSFTHTGGKFTIVNDHRINPSLASLYFDPETVSLASGTAIAFGKDGETSSSYNSFTLYAAKTLQNLVIDSVGTKLTLNIVPCVIKEDLTISSGTEFDANGLDLTIKGDLTNAGTFTATGNKTYFSGNVTDQMISGTTTFYDLYKTATANNLILASDITVENDLHFTQGTFDDGGNDLFAKGDMEIDITTSSGTSNYGIIACGDSQQNLTGSGTLAKFKTDNANGILVPTGNTITITDQLSLNKGIFDIGKNLLVLTKKAKIIGSTFSETNMIQTNISFTDAGVKKYFPKITSLTTFTYPMGSGGKYTPVVLDITNSDVDNTYIRVKAADEMHPSVVEDSETPEITDADNVLRYYWILDSEGASNFSGKAYMQAYPGDVYVTSPYSAADYITARLLSRSSGLWDKYISDDFNENTSELTFEFTNTNDAGIDGDYTAGIDDAIPDEVTLYTSTTNGSWKDQSIWTPTPPAGGPRGSRVLIKHKVTIPDNYIVAYETMIDGTGKLDVGTTFRHRLGIVSGTGTLYMERGDMPAGDYTGFFAADSGTVEFGGISLDYDILSELDEINNLVVSGSGERRLPNIDVQLLGDLTIDGPELASIDVKGRDLKVKKDINFKSGMYTAKFSSIVMNGSVGQTISGNDFTGANAMYDFEIYNSSSSGVTLSNSVNVTNDLYLTLGEINTSQSNKLTITNPSKSCVIGGDNTSYVSGPLFKVINNSDNFTFPVGDVSRYGKVVVEVDASSGGTWEAQFYNHNPDNDGMDPTSVDGDAGSVNQNEYWRIKAPSSTLNANITLYWDNSSGVTPDDGFRVVKWTDLSTDAWQDVTVNSKSGTASSGSATLATLSFNEWASFNDGGNFFTFGTGPLADIYWKGDISSNWFTADNWTGNIVPNSSKDVKINTGYTYAPEITAGTNVSIQSLVIGSGATLTMKPGSRMTIYSGLTTNDGLVVENTVNAPASLLTLGSVSGNTTVKWTYPNGSYWYVGHPVNGVKYSDYTDAAPVNGVSLYRYTGSTWSKITDVNYNFDGVNTAEGYAVKFEESSDVVVTHSGGMRTGNYTRSINGWNLIGNPYPTYIDVEDAGFNIGNSLPTVWISLHGTGEATYATYNLDSNIGSPEGSGSRYIAPSQSFWLRNYSSSTFSISNTVRCIEPASGEPTNLKSANKGESDVLRLTLNNAGHNDELALAFRRIGVNDKFTSYDSEKRFSSGHVVPNIYALKEDKKIVIGVYPDEIDKLDTITLGYKFSKQGQVTLRASNINDFSVLDNIYLLDKMTGIETNLRINPEYTFTSKIGGEADRFVIYFSKMEGEGEYTGVDDLGNASDLNISIYGSGSRAYVKVPGKILRGANGEGIIRVYNTLGSLLKEVKLIDAKTTIELPGNHGLYIIEVRAGDKIVTGKVSRTD